MPVQAEEEIAEIGPDIDYPTFNFSRKFADHGCRLHHACLTCPFPKCKDDYKSDNDAIVAFWEAGHRGAPLFNMYSGNMLLVPDDVLQDNGMMPKGVPSKNDLDGIIREMYSGGMTYREIAGKLHVSNTYIAEAIRVKTFAA